MVLLNHGGCRIVLITPGKLRRALARRGAWLVQSAASCTRQTDGALAACSSLRP
jgi:hypothetical protein